MSASDSDYSIDWLASDDEDHDSELEPDCTKAQGQTTLQKSPSSGVIQGTQTCQSLSKRNGDKGEVMDKENMSSRGSSPSSCDSSDYSEDGGDCHLGQEALTNYSRCPESPVGKMRQALKRTCSSMIAEQWERQLTPEQMEKDRLFACKVRRANFWIVGMPGKGHGVLKIRLISYTIYLHPSWINVKKNIINIWSRTTSRKTPPPCVPTRWNVNESHEATERRNSMFSSTL